MAIRDKQDRRPVIDLTGPSGNAFVLLGYVGTLGKQLSFEASKIEAIRAEMMAGNYEHVVEVFDKHFGEYVDLER